VLESRGVSTQDDGQVILAERVANLVDDEVDRQCGGPGGFKGKWRSAGSLVESMLNRELDEFLTSVCYPLIVTTAYESSTQAKP
jgi:hypothetical protein